MNKEMSVTLVRQVLLVVGGFLALKGIVPQSVVDKITDVNTLTAVVGAVTTLGTIIWGLSKRTDAAIVATADKLPGVKGVEVTDSKLAAKVSSPTVKVVSSY